jgi:hypothetical protein
MSKKFQYQVTQDNDSWKAEIIRRVSSKKTTVSKQQSGFSSEEEAKDWAETELAQFLKQLSAKNKSRAESRQQ